MAIKQATCVPFGLPVWSREAAIGDYDGHPEKRASATEGDVPYAFTTYQELQAMRGSGYTQKPATLVHCENLAIARMHSAIYLRAPEKIRANSTPGGSDEKLPYWVEVLKIPVRDSDQRWQIRERAANKYKAAQGPTFQLVYERIQELLGDAFVDLQQTTGAALSTPPAYTYWPTANPGSVAYDLGGGAWFTERARLVIVVEQPPGMTLDEFLQLMNVQLFALLDPLLPIWATWEWVVEGDGFNLDLDSLDLEGLTPS